RRLPRHDAAPDCRPVDRGAPHRRCDRRRRPSRWPGRRMATAARAPVSRAGGHAARAPHLDGRRLSAAPRRRRAARSRGRAPTARRPARGRPLGGRDDAPAAAVARPTTGEPPPLPRHSAQRRRAGGEPAVPERSDGEEAEARQSSGEQRQQPERSLLSTAAIIGRQFDFSLLLEAAGADPDDATAGLEELVRRRLLKVVDSRFAFAHERLREAVQAQLLPPRRAVLHAAVGRAIEACYGRDLSRDYTDLAVHFSAGEVWDKALTYCRLAGVQAMERAAHREAVSWFKQTLDVLARLPETREMLETAIDVRLMLSAERQLIGERQSFESHEIAAEIARRLHDERRETRVLNFLSYKLMTHGELGRAERVGRQALALAERLGDVELVAAGALVVGHALKGQGRFREALRHFRGNIEPLTDERLAIRFGGGRPAIMSRAHAAWCLAELGEFIEGRRLGL